MGDEMSKSNRVLDLYQALQNGQVINKKAAAEAYGVNEKSIQRDLDSIRDFLSEQTTQQGLIQSVEFDRAANGYRLVTEEMITDWLEDMSECGLLDPLEERLMDAASALSGSGPAYLYLMLEAMADGGVACGLPRAKALDYAAMTMAGAAEIYLSTHAHPGALKDAVCSPGGSTIAGVRILEERGFRGAAMDCVCAAYAKNKELGK